MSRELPPPVSRPLRDRAVQPLREALENLGVLTEGRSAEELIILAARELRAVRWARDERARRTEQQQQAYRLRHLALPSSVREPWALGAAVDVYELSWEAPYHHLRGQGVIAERRMDGEEVVSLRVSRGRTSEVLTRRLGSPYAWGDTGSLTFAALAGTPLTPLTPGRVPKLRIFTWTEEEYRLGEDGSRDTRGSRVPCRFVIACGSLRELNVILKRTRNEWPHVQESAAPEREAWAQDYPLILFKSAPFDSPTPPPDLAYAPVPFAEAGRAWVELHRRYGG